MLVIISDIHLTDGSSGATVHQGTLRVFRERLRSLAYAASWRADGKYRPIEELNILLLGDALDVLRSSQWIEQNAVPSRVRPWSDPGSPVFIQKVDAITKGILEENAVFFAMLRELHHTNIASVPPATAEGHPARSASEAEAGSRVAVRVRIHYMVGNHDWFYHLPGRPYHDIRRRVVEALGLENDFSQPFPHDPEEAPARAIKEVLDEHRVFARHGDIYDPYNFEGNRDASSLGDAIVIDLVSSFAAEVQSRLGDSLPPESLAGFNEIDNVRPLLMVPVWVGGLLRRTCADHRLQRQVQDVWSDLVNRFARIPFVQQRLSSPRLFPRAQIIKWALKLSRNFLRPESSRLISWAGPRFAARDKSYYAYALGESAFKRGRARFIVYGHTHHHEMVPLDSPYSPDSPSAQLYLNSGTWRPVHELARFKPGHETFIGHHSMTYLAFFKADERNGRTFEYWSGGLANSSAVRRL